MLIYSRARLCFLIIFGFIYDSFCSLTHFVINRKFSLSFQLMLTDFTLVFCDNSPVGRGCFMLSVIDFGTMCLRHGVHPCMWHILYLESLLFSVKCAKTIYGNVDSFLAKYVRFYPNEYGVMWFLSWFYFLWKYRRVVMFMLRTSLRFFYFTPIEHVIVIWFVFHLQGYQHITHADNKWTEEASTEQ